PGARDEAAVGKGVGAAGVALHAARARTAPAARPRATKRAGMRTSSTLSAARRDCALRAVPVALAPGSEPEHDTRAARFRLALPEAPTRAGELPGQFGAVTGHSRHLLPAGRRRTV